MVMGEIRDLRLTQTEGNNDNWKLEKTVTEKKAVKQSGYPWNESKDINVYKFTLHLLT